MQLAVKSSSAFTQLLPSHFHSAAPLVFDFPRLVFFLCFAMAALVFFALFYALWVFRQPQPVANRGQDLAVEMLWMLVPFVFFLLMVGPATKLFICGE